MECCDEGLRAPLPFRAKPPGQLALSPGATTLLGTQHTTVKSATSRWYS
jgi:hypothetical protein